MKRWFKIVLLCFGVVLLSVIVVFCWFFSQAVPLANGYVAKYLCSSTFISKRDPGIVFKEDLMLLDPRVNIINWKINRHEKSVTADTFGFFKLKAIYRNGCGCSLVIGMTEKDVRAQKLVPPDFEQNRPRHSADRPWPLGNQGPVDPSSLGIDTAKLKKALDAAFSEPGPEKQKNTRAVVVVYDGALVAERYAPGFHKDMPLLGWSISKSVTNALVGILVRKGKLDIHQPAPVPEWQQGADPRRKITLDQLLRMSSGLEFEEVYGDPLSDASEMFGSSDFGAFAAAKDQESEPDARWHYSSGTTNIVSRIVRQTVEQDYKHYYRFIYEELFHKIGMYSAILEPDSSGTFVGSSYAIATPRDWARFGLLYLQKGLWQGERILPKGWVAYTTTPTPQAPIGEYGAFFWLNAGAPSNPSNRYWPHAPRDAFAAEGFHEQRVIVVPSKTLVLVRFGDTSKWEAWSGDEFIRDFLAALPV